MSDYITELAGRIRAMVDPSVIPDDPPTLPLFRLYALLVLVKGTATTREDVHDAWVVWMVGVDGEHGALLPFNELTTDQQLQDQPFLEAIWEIAHLVDDL